MGLSRITAASIANNAENITISPIGPYEPDDEKPQGANIEGRYGAMICWGPNHPHHPGMLIVDCSCTYETPELAVAALQDLVNQLVEKFGPNSESEGDAED